MLRLEQANEVIAAAMLAASRDGVPPLAVVVLDASGHLLSAQRQDGATMFRVDVAGAKAWGAVAFGTSSRELATRAKDNPNFFSALADTARGRLLPQPGAVLIRSSDGQVLGAVGASGGTGDQDEACCERGLESAGLLVRDHG